MRLVVPVALAVLGLGVAVVGPALPASGEEERPTTTPARDGDAGAADLAARVERAIGRGVQHLLDTQKEDGSWGGPAPNLTVDIYAPRPGSNRAFTVAASALALSALVELDSEREDVRAAVAKGTTWLMGRYGVRRPSPDALYNVWAHLYCLEAFARLLAREEGEEPRKRLQKAAAGCVRWLQRMQFVEGGWGYYNFSEQTRAPGPGSTSFTTASVVVALAMAREQGVEVPEAMLQKGNRLIRRCEVPGGSFAYSYSTRMWATIGTNGNINRTQGSLARTPACILAWRLSGAEVDPARFPQALDELERYGHFLRLARKYPVPHETWYQNSGYFCLYGYYYAAQCIAFAPAAKRAIYRRQIAGHLLAMQEKGDGSWWDYQLYRTHKPYGTGYALMALYRCRP